jgi:hypothetical protein
MGRGSLVVVCLVACDDGALDIAGAYTDAFGTDHDIDEATWSQSTGTGYASTYAVASFDNGAQYLVAQNGDENGYGAGAWSRFDWARADGALYYCQTAFDAPTEQDAEGAARGDDSDPASVGCGGFAWTALSPR